MQLTRDVRPSKLIKIYLKYPVSFDCGPDYDVLGVFIPRGIVEELSSDGYIVILMDGVEVSDDLVPGKKSTSMCIRMTSKDMPESVLFPVDLIEKVEVHEMKLTILTHQFAGASR